MEKLKVVPGIIKAIVEKQKPILFDRCHIASLGDYSVRVETVYFVLDPDFNKYMDIQQSINLEIFQTLLDQGIYFVATPHVQLAPQPSGPSAVPARDEQKE